jgi:hypothetical protein
VVTKNRKMPSIHPSLPPSTDDRTYRILYTSPLNSNTARIPTDTFRWIDAPQRSVLNSSLSSSLNWGTPVFLGSVRAEPDWAAGLGPFVPDPWRRRRSPAAPAEDDDDDACSARRRSVSATSCAKDRKRTSAWASVVSRSMVMLSSLQY